MSSETPRINPPGPGDHVILIDGSSFVFRAYFQSIRQDQRYNYRSDRLPTGAVRIFATKLVQFIREGARGRKATHLAMIFDKSENSFRKALFPAYKANRSEPPEDLVPQFPLMRAVVRAFGYQPIEMDTYEADDLIATYAGQAVRAGAEVTIVSADKDLMQLIEPGVVMYDPASGEREERLIGEAEVFEYFGVKPDRVVDVQSLAGDSTDNVPGAPGIGVKTAAQLIAEYGDLDTLLARAGEIKQPKRRETLTDPEVVEKVRISRRLVTLVRDVPVEAPLKTLVAHDPTAEAAVAFLKAMEFTTLTRRVADLYGVAVDKVEPDPAYAKGGTAPAEPGDSVAPEAGSPSGGGVTLAAAPPEGPAGLAATRLAALRAMPVKHEAYEAVQTAAALAAWLDRARERGILAFDTETNSLDPMQADLVGVSLSTAPGEGCYVPLQHRSGDGLFDSGPVPGQIPLAEALALLKPVLEDAAVLKIGQNIKFDLLVMRQHGVDITPVDDTMLLSYVLDAGRHGHGMDELSTLHLHHKPIPFSEVAGKGKAAVTFDQVPIDKATHYAAEDADITLRLWLALKPRLVAEGMVSVYETLERGMPDCLAAMEARGIAIDRQILSRLSGEFAQGMARLEAEIHALAGESFNLGSPKQLGDILFGKMGLSGGKKTATGAWSTGADVLEDLAAEGHELPARLLEWRQMQKLKSTYTDALPGYVNPRTNRVHTSFSLASTTTGRLASSEPNIQNIPVRNEMGRKIRTAFVAEPGRLLVSADYSQIELRILAHIAEIPQLRKAFDEGVDIHAMTASEMFNVPLSEMTGEIRRRAKAINFGIIYGISAFGLANQLSIPREEAGAYIRKYFERFPGIKDYMEAMKAKVRKDGYVETVFGRKCHYPAIDSKNPSERAFMERAAINAPIQGSAADIIRRAMLRMDAALAERRVPASMLLQVHDELIFEVPEAEAARAIPVITRVMEEAPLPLLQLKVPLKVDARAARNWDEAH
ncbi:DNA polymerase I [Rhabdaerophilum sp. SD176]|uniref:DNA polymerase I n=1 Tax=Rhabdaerophilum sp. SD176 TaxID=2983548 RepID=UPI0024DF9E5C|nr:DNA polymerase I [Rhabdaerophilum sp. SD176]